VEKVKLAEEYRQLVQSAAGVILFDYRGLSVGDLSQLRRGMRSQGASVRVIRNRMLKRAVEDLPYAEISRHLVGPTALTVARGDPAAAAKALVDFARSHEEMRIKCGVVDGRMIPAERIAVLAKLPSREVLMAQILGGIVTPMAALAACLGSFHQQILGLIEAYRSKLEQTAQSQIENERCAALGHAPV
jgi:large subunit ribosomal protein L10